MYGARRIPAALRAGAMTRESPPWQLQGRIPSSALPLARPVPGREKNERAARDSSPRAPRRAIFPRTRVLLSHMASPLSIFGRSLLLAATLAASTAFATAQCAITLPLGTNLGLILDDTLSAQTALGFQFPFNGVNYDSVYVCSNGFLYLFDSTGAVAPPTLSPYVPTVATILASTSPMICGPWMDLDPQVGGTVNLNTFAGPPASATITWDQVPERNQTHVNTFQITLWDNGQMDFYWSPNFLNITHTALVGWSEGNGAADPGPTDFSSAVLTTSAFTAYELLGAGSFDLIGQGFTAIPAPGSFLIVPAPCAGSSTYGQGCPKASTTYELFGGSTFDMSGGSLLFQNLGGRYLVTTCATNCWDPAFVNNLGLGDDALALNQQLGFTFPFFGGGSTTAIDVCSNCFVWMNTGSSASADYSPTAAELLSNPPRLCPVWMDLNPLAGGGVYFDTTPSKAMVTWDNCFAFGTTSPNSIQLQLFPSGDFIVAWQQVINNATLSADAICGFSQGNGASDPGPIDFSTAVPFTTGSGGTPVALAAQAGSRPQLGGTFVMEASNLPAGTLLGMTNVGFINPNIPLDFLGMDGCTLLTDIQGVFPMTLSLPGGMTSFGIPNVPAFAGGQMNAQAIVVNPSFNPFGVAASNGVRMVFGF